MFRQQRLIKLTMSLLLLEGHENGKGMFLATILETLLLPNALVLLKQTQHMTELQFVFLVFYLEQ